EAKLLALRAAALPADSQLIAAAVQSVREAGKPKSAVPDTKPADGPKRPESASVGPMPATGAPSPEVEEKARAAYALLRQNLDPLLATFDTDGARKLLARIPKVDSPA